MHKYIPPGPAICDSVTGSMDIKMRAGQRPEKSGVFEAHHCHAMKLPIHEQIMLMFLQVS